MQKVKWWYYYYSRTESKPSTPDVSQKPGRKPSRLPLHQAYSRLFCAKDTPLHADLRAKWEAFVNGDTTYTYLFPNRDPTPLRFVTFQQAVLKDMIPSISEDERRQLEKYIEERFAEEIDHFEHPWKAFKVDDAQTDEDLEREYTAG